MTYQDAQVIFSNKKSLGYNGIFRDLGSSIFGLVVSYLFVSLISWKLLDLVSFWPIIVAYLLLRSLYFSLRRHTVSVQFLESQKTFLIHQKNHIGKDYEYRISDLDESSLSHLSDSYGRVNFDIKQGRKSIYLSSHQLGLSKKKVKKIYNRISETFDLNGI